MIDPQTGVAAIGVSEVIPECVDPLDRMELAQGISPTLGYEAPVGFAGFRTEQGVAEPALRFVDVEIGGHDVVVAGEDDRRTCRKQVGRVGREALEPAQLVVEFRARRGVAVWQVETAYQDPMHGRLDVAAVTVVGIFGETTAGFLRLYPAREDGDAVPALLAMPNRAIVRVPDRSFRKLLLRSFQLLQADHVGRGFF